MIFNLLKFQRHFFLFIGVVLTACSSSPANETFLSQRGIAFVQRNEQGAYIYTIDANGKNLKQLTRINVYSNSIKWSPDGKYIAFTSKTSGTEQIYTVNVTDLKVKQLTFGKFESDTPSWSPDGHFITFTTMVSPPNEPNSKQVFIMKFDGSEQKQLTFGQSNSINPAWSPSGKQILYIYDHIDVVDNESKAIQSLYVMRADGSDQYSLVKEFVSSASWYSNDLVSVSTPESRHGLKTYIVDLNGAILYQIPETSTDGIPSWSPNGDFIAFEHMSGLESPKCSGISVIEPGSVNSCFVIDKILPPVQAHTPSWSPDSKFIAFSSNLNGDFDLYLSKADGSGLVQLTNIPGDEEGPIWSPVP